MVDSPAMRYHGIRDVVAPVLIAAVLVAIPALLPKGIFHRYEQRREIIQRLDAILPTRLPSTVVGMGAVRGTLDEHCRKVLGTQRYRIDWEALEKDNLQANTQLDDLRLYPADDWLRLREHPSLLWYLDESSTIVITTSRRLATAPRARLVYDARPLLMTIASMGLVLDAYRYEIDGTGELCQVHAEDGHVVVDAPVLLEMKIEYAHASLINRGKFSVMALWLPEEFFHR